MMPVSTNDFANKLRKVADFYDEFGLSPKIAALLYDASNIARSFSGIVDKNDELKAENKKLLELVTELHSLATDEVVYVGYDRDGIWDKRMDAAEDVMRELGIEVKECMTR